MNALFIGRFQPFHKGHLEIIRKISAEYQIIIIGIGSSQYQNTLENPFSESERKEMIIESLKEEGIKNFKIVLIPDIHNPPKWVEHVNSIISDYSIVITNSPKTKKLFTKKGYEVKNTPIYNRKLLSGYIIRKKMINGESLGELLPIPVIKIIKKIKGQERLIKLNNNYKTE